MKQIKNNWFCWLSIIFFLFLSATSINAAIYYVSPTGTATWAQCTNINTPCSVLTAFANAKAGDTVYFRGGTYNITGTNSWYLPDLRPANSGTPDAPINFEGYPGETAIFVANNANSPVFGTRQKSWINFKNFIVDTSAVSGGNGRPSFMFGSDSESQKSTNITVENCIVIGHEIPSTDHAGGISIKEFTESVTVRNCKIYNWTGGDTAGISIWNATNAIIENNEIYNCAKGIENTEGISGNIIRYNYIHNIGPYPAIQIWTQDGVNPSNSKIYQNILSNCNGGGIDFQGAPEIFNGFLIYNNTLYKCGGIGLTGVPNTEVFNNIIWNESRDEESGSYIFHHNSTSDPSIVNYNLYWPYLRFGYRIYAGGSYYTTMPWSPKSYDINSKNQNPLFVNAGGSLVTDYKLQSNSPGLAGGRGGIYSNVMGAYITGNECIGLLSNCNADNSPPSPPRNLRIQ